MTQAQQISVPLPASAPGAWWRLSWPLLMALLTYVYLFAHTVNSAHMMQDGDTYWHVAAGRWILDHGFVPTTDPFSHTMAGSPWVAHEWLSEVLLAWAHQWGGWTWVVALAAGAFAWTVALLTREMLKWMEPIHALMFGCFAVAMTAGHALARPHMLAMPLMMIWMIGLVRASDAGRAPSWWLLAVMPLWANLHGGFTLGLLLICAFALEAIVNNWGRRDAMLVQVRAWGLFFLLALACSLLTPHGPRALWFTWHVMVASSFALDQISEWRSPNFHLLQPLEIWLIGGLAVALYQGIRLPLIRLAILLGLIHLALKHARHIELLGLVAPLVIGAPLGQQLSARRQGQSQAAGLDGWFLKLVPTAGHGAIALAAAVILAVPAWMAGNRTLTPPDNIAPTRAVQAAQAAGLRGPVLNEYDWGGWLAFSGIPPFIDGRSDMYGDPFMKAYIEAVQLTGSGAFDKVAKQYKVEWTLLRPSTSAVALLDHSPEWRRVYADDVAVVHARVAVPTR